MATTVAATKHCKAAIDSLNETGVARTLFLRLLRSCHRIIVVVKRLTIRQHPHPSVTASVSSENVSAAWEKQLINSLKDIKLGILPNPVVLFKARSHSFKRFRKKVCAPPREFPVS